MFAKMLIDDANQVRNDGMMHYSSGLQNDRHAVLGYVHGYPDRKRPWGEVAQLVTGTAIHEYIHTMFSNSSELIKYIPEIKVDYHEIKGIGWTGTADAIAVDTYGKRYLIDYKTTSSNTFEYLQGKPKPEHIMQVSAYYHHLKDYNVYRGDMACGIMYIPVSPTFSRKWEDPVFMEFDPLPYDTVIGAMERVVNAINSYRLDGYAPAFEEGEWSWKFDKKIKKWKFTYKPHWSSRYCPWDHMIDDPCECSTQKPIDGGTYDPIANEYALTEIGADCIDSVTKPWELDNDEKV